MTTAAVFPDVLMAAAKVPAKTLPELIAHARAHPGAMNCGSAGNGTSRHLSCELFNLQAGVKAFEEPDMKELWFKLRAEPGGAPSDEFRALVAREVAKWGKVVREARISVD